MTAKSISTLLTMIVLLLTTSPSSFAGKSKHSPPPPKHHSPPPKRHSPPPPPPAPAVNQTQAQIDAHNRAAMALHKAGTPIKICGSKQAICDAAHPCTRKLSDCAADEIF